MKVAVASIDPTKVIKLFESWGAAKQYAVDNPDHFVSVSLHEDESAAIAFANELHEMTPEWSLELL